MTVAIDIYFLERLLCLSQVDSGQNGKLMNTQLTITISIDNIEKVSIQWNKDLIKDFILFMLFK